MSSIKITNLRPFPVTIIDFCSVISANSYIVVECSLAGLSKKRELQKLSINGFVSVEMQGIYLTFDEAEEPRCQES